MNDALSTHLHGDPGPAALDIERLEGLLAKATPGPPWRTMDEYIDSADRPPPIASAFYSFATMKGGDHHEEAVANATLIVEAVNALRHLLAIAKAHLAKPVYPHGRDLSHLPLLDRLRMWVQPPHKSYPTHQMNPDGDEAATRIEALAAEVGRLREALEPLAREANRIVNPDCADDLQLAPLSFCKLTVGHVRAARAALENSDER